LIVYLTVSSSETLESLLANLKKQSDEGMIWSMKIHLSAMDEIRNRR